jgi:hypothetical protein
VRNRRAFDPSRKLLPAKIDEVGRPFRGNGGELGYHRFQTHSQSFFSSLINQAVLGPLRNKPKASRLVTTNTSVAGSGALTVTEPNTPSVAAVVPNITPAPSNVSSGSNVIFKISPTSEMLAPNAGACASNSAKSASAMVVPSSADKLDAGMVAESSPMSVMIPAVNNDVFPRGSVEANKAFSNPRDAFVAFAVNVVSAPSPVIPGLNVTLVPAAKSSKLIPGSPIFPKAFTTVNVLLSTSKIASLLPAALTFGLIVNWKVPGDPAAFNHNGHVLVSIVQRIAERDIYRCCYCLTSWPHCQQACEHTRHCYPDYEPERGWDTGGCLPTQDWRLKRLRVKDHPAEHSSLPIQIKPIILVNARSISEPYGFTPPCAIGPFYHSQQRKQQT